MCFLSLFTEHSKCDFFFIALLVKISCWLCILHFTFHICIRIYLFKALNKDADTCCGCSCCCSCCCCCCCCWRHATNVRHSICCWHFISKTRSGLNVAKIKRCTQCTTHNGRCNQMLQVSRRIGLGRIETSRAELRHPQLNLIKSTLGVGLRVKLGFFMNEIVKGLGDGDDDAPTSQRDEIMNEHGPSPGAKRARAVERQSETWAANANWWPGLRCDAHHSISGTSGQTIVSISHAHRNRISMIIIMSRKTGKPVKPNSLECQQMNWQMLRHRFVHSMKTFPNLSRHEWLRFSYIEGGGGAVQSAGIYALSLANGIVFQRLSTVVIVLYTKCSNIFKSLSLVRLNTVSALDNEES